MHQLSSFIFIFFLFSLLLFTTITMATEEEKLLYEANAPDYKPSFPLDPHHQTANKQQYTPQQSLFDKIAPDPTLSTFMDVLTQNEDIFQLLNDSSTQGRETVYTVFCPVNTAFRNDLDIYTREHLKEFLMNHIVPMDKILDPKTLQHTTKPLKTMLKGQEIQVSHHFFSKKTLLNDHAVVDITHYVQAVNGIAYKIDHLLRPYTTT